MLRRVHPSLWVLGGMVALYVGVFGSLTWAQQSNFGTFGFDMGIYDQGIWLMSRFKDPFITVRGLEWFGHHVIGVTFLFVPFYWLGAGPHFLYLVETMWLAVGAVPIWLLARDRLENPWTALALAAAYLLYPSLEWINWWHFHPDALLITPLLFAYWLATRRRWGWFAVAVGADYRVSKVQLERNQAAINPFTNSVVDVAHIKLNSDITDNHGWGWNATRR